LVSNLYFSGRLEERHQKSRFLQGHSHLRDNDENLELEAQSGGLASEASSFIAPLAD
jgi:hypothetical protein